MLSLPPPPRRSPFAPLGLIVLLGLALLPACRNKLLPAQAPVSAITGPAHKEVHLVTEPDFEGFRIRLSDAAPSAESEATVARIAADSSPLSAERTGALLARLPPIEVDPSDTQPFARRPDSPPPPRTGETVDVPFPAPAGPPSPRPEEAGPLRVLRSAPDGEVPLAPHLSITFNQPMVALMGQDEAATHVPVTLEPNLAGQWRWLGTKTLLFEPAPRFPMATTFTATVPAGTRSAAGEPLGAAHRVQFGTPPIGLRAQHPIGGPQGLSPVVFLAFDQAIDRDALLPYVALRSHREPAALRLATQAEVDGDPTVSAMSRSTAPDRWIAVVPTAPLARETTYTVEVRPGAPSAEGPRTTTKAQAFSFATYGPLALVEAQCAWGRDACPPTVDWHIRFSNPLAAGAADIEGWTVSPEVRDLRVQASGPTVVLSSVKAGRTQYRVTVPPGLEDIFGQTLGPVPPRTFDVGPADTMLAGPGREFFVLDPGGPPIVPVYSVNQPVLKVRAFAAGPEDWAGFSRWMSRRWDEARPTTPPLRKLATTTVTVASAPDAVVETGIDLRPWLPQGQGSVVLWIEPARQPAQRWRRSEVFVWAQVTELGLAAFHDATELVAWATHLQTGASAAGLDVELLSGDPPVASASGVTGPDGLATLALPRDPEGPQLLVARKDGAVLGFLPQNAGWWNEHPGWSHREQGDELRWLVHDDRGLYRPGETVSVKGWVRRHETRRGGALRETDVTQVDWILRGPQWNELDRGRVSLTPLGGFDLALTLPADMNLGSARLEIAAADGGAAGNRTHAHALRVAEFRRPEFEVKAAVDPGPWVLGEHAVIEVAASYYAGGGLPGAPTRWSTRTSPASYSPPGWEGWSFGVWSPWWRAWHGPATAEGDHQSHEGTTDGLGTHRLRIDFEQMSPPRPWTVHAEATVTDVNRQGWTAKSTLLVHPADLTVGLRTTQSFVAAGTPVVIEAAAVALDGTAAVGAAIEVAFERLEWRSTRGEWREEAVDRSICALRSTATPGRCTFSPSVGGSWRVMASTRDAHGRRAQSESRVWVSGGAARPSRDLVAEELTLVPDAQEYQPGDTARVLIQSPFAPFEALVTWQRSGLVRSERIRSEEPTYVLSTQVEEAWISQVTLRVDAVGQAARIDDAGQLLPDAPPRPAFARGEVSLSVPPARRTLDVQVRPEQAELEPGGSTHLAITVRGADGRPRPGAELTVVVVDEAVLALTGHALPDPLALFHAARPGGVMSQTLHAHVVLADAARMASSSSPPSESLQVEADIALPSAPGGAVRRGGQSTRTMAMGKMADASGYAEGEPMEASPDAGPTGGDIALRSRFDALALFAPSVLTDSAGAARVALSLPDSLTRYRVMVIAVSAADQFGRGESSVVARKPLMIRPSPPRFLNFGDRIELPVVVQNQGTEAMTVEVALRATNLTVRNGAFADGAGLSVRVPAQDRAEVRFPVDAALAGTARFQVLGVARRAAHEWTDAATLALPVWTPATAEAFATYGTIDSGAIVQPVQAPADVFPGFGGLEITTSSTALQALTDAVLYLTNYPYECAEQISSRVLGVAALRDVLTAFEADELPSPDALNAAVASDLERLGRQQNPDGGFGFWRRGETSWPWVSVHAAHALARAGSKGYAVEPEVRARAVTYLRRIDAHIPRWVSLESRRAIVAYAIHVRDLLADDPSDRARALWSEAGPDGLSNEALGWLLAPMASLGDTAAVTSIERQLLNRVAETAGTAHFVDAYSDGAHVLMHSGRRSDAVVLEALIRTRPGSDLIPKLAAGLLAHRSKGRWANTQENVFVLLALDRYFAAYERDEPDFVARAWLGADYAGEHHFVGRTTNRAHIAVPMEILTSSKGAQALTLQKDGAGRLYYRLGLRYAPTDLTLAPADRGFVVERSYEGVDAEGDVRREADGSWRVRAGARVRVRLTMVASGRRYHVALVDPLPAGLEPINPELAVSEGAPPETGGPEDPSSGRGAWWWRPWYEHQNLRDERVEVFTSLLWDGVHRFSYLARATTPGEFVVPPARAEEMYAPETFGRSASDRVVVR